jgi:hypothetical protein
MLHTLKYHLERCARGLAGTFLQPQYIYLMEDSVPLVPTNVGSADKKRSSSGGPMGLTSVKMLFTLFLIFIFVASDFFTDSVLSGFGEKAVKGRSPTSWGTVLQGIFIVILFALAGHLTDSGVL